MANVRNTKQRQLILSLLKETDKPMSINELHSQLVKELPKIANQPYRTSTSLTKFN